MLKITIYFINLQHINNFSMKKLILLSFFLAIFLPSCSCDETQLEAESGNSFFPMSMGNFWNYNIDFQTNNSRRDSLFIKKDTIINGFSYKKFKTKNTPIGFYSAIINGNSLRQSNNKLLLTGNAGLNFTAGLPIDLSLNDFIIFSENAVENEQLSDKAGVLTQTVSNLPLSLDYILKSVAMSSLTTYTTPGGKTYQNVKPIKIIFNLKITTLFSGFPIPVLNQQDVVTSTLYFAKNIGVVYAKTRIKYQLQSFALPPGTAFPIPTSADQTQEEFLTTYKSN